MLNPFFLTTSTEKETQVLAQTTYHLKKNILEAIPLCLSLRSPQAVATHRLIHSDGNMKAKMRSWLSVHLTTPPRKNIAFVYTAYHYKIHGTGIFTVPTFG